MTIDLTPEDEQLIQKRFVYQPDVDLICIMAAVRGRRDGKRVLKGRNL